MANYTNKPSLAAWNAMQNAVTAATEGRGNVKLVWGSYKGTGRSGSGSSNYIEFESTPLWVTIWPSPGAHDTSLTAWYGLSSLQSYVSGVAHSIVSSWSSIGMSWFADSAAAQMNESGKTYFYLVLLEA